MTSPSDRREFLSGKAALRAARPAHEQDPSQCAVSRVGATLQLTTRAMACDFSVIMNGGEQVLLWKASTELDAVHDVEQRLTVYRDESEVSQLNVAAQQLKPIHVSSDLLELLDVSQKISEWTDGAFDLTAGPLIRLWKACRLAQRVPEPTELDAALACVGMRHVQVDVEGSTVRFDRVGMSVDFGAIGKGHALDQMADAIKRTGCGDFLMHGGRSSLLAVGAHVGCDGWPVGIGNPLITDRRLGSIVLRNQAMSTSGSNIQYFRVGQQRFGHILDPRTGWPAEGCLSVVVVCASAAVADALSTAFYVMGPERVAEYCALRPDVGAIVIPFPKSTRLVRPEVHNIDSNRLVWDREQVAAQGGTTE